MSFKKYILLSFICVFALKMHAQDTLSLSRAIQIGLENNYDLKIMRNTETEATINNTWGNTNVVPSIDFALSGTEDIRNYSSDSGNDYKNGYLSPELSLDWVLFNGFSAHITKSRYQVLEDQSKGNTAVLVETTIQDIIDAYYVCILQNELLTVYKDLEKLSKDRYDREETSKDLGATTTYELLQAKTSWLEDKSNYLDQEVTFENAVRTLNYVIGEKDDVSWKLTSHLETDFPDYQIADMENKLMNNNQTIKNEYLNQALLAKETALAKADLYPSLNFSASGAYVSNNVNYSESGLTDTKTKYTNYGLGLTLSYNLYSGGQRRRSVKIAKIEEESAAIETEQMKHSLRNDLLQQYSTYNVQKELLDLANEKEDAAKLNLDLANEKLKNGTMDSFDFRDIQISFMNAATDKLTAIYNLIESKTELLRMTGGIVEQYNSTNN